MTLFQYKGSAVQTTLAANITDVETTIALGSGTGWPDGAGSFVFVATIGDEANGDTEEKILCTAQAAGTLTVSQRGYDDTVAANWPQGTMIRHTLSAKAMQEASDHIADATLHMTVADHAAIAHDQSMMAANSIGSAQIQDDAVGTAELAPLSVTSAELANLAVIAGKIAANAVGASELADVAVDTAAIVDDAVTAAKVADGAIDNTLKILDGIITLAKLASEAPTTYVPTFTNVTLGGGSVAGAYFKLGRLVVGMAQFTLGGTGDVTGTIECSLPVAAGTYGVDWLYAARGYDSSGSTGASGLGVILDGESVGKNVVTIGNNFWGASIPWNWAPGDTLRSIFFYAAAT